MAGASSSSSAARNLLPAWLKAASAVDFDSAAAAAGSGGGGSTSPSSDGGPGSSSVGAGDASMGMGERSISAAGAAFISAILMNPLDVAKTRLQAQAAGVEYYPVQAQYGRQFACLDTRIIFSDLHCVPSCTRCGIFLAEPSVSSDALHYKGTFDVFNKVVRHEGLRRLWRGTNAALALSVPTVGIYLPCYDIFRNRIEDFTKANAPYLTPYAPLVAGSVARSLACITCYPIELARTRMQAFKEFQAGAKPPGVWKTLLGVVSPLKGTNGYQNVQGYRLLWTGVGAQLARDVPFSAICWSTLEPIRKRLLSLVGEEGNAATVLGANFSSGFVAGSLAAGLTCPLDVAKTRRQIEKDPVRAFNMTTWQTLVEVWSKDGMKGLFTGVGPRVARAGPSVGIVVSFYEVVKYVLHQRKQESRRS